MLEHQRRARGAIALAVSMLLLPSVSAFAAGEAVGETSPFSAEDVAELQNAIAFREIFGLSSDSETARKAATSPDSSRNYGVPLSAAEEKELDRRAQVEEDSYAAAAFGRKDGSWAGFYFDQHARGIPVFLFAGDVSAMRSRVADQLPDGMDFAVEQVPRTLSQLRETRDAIAASFDDLRAAGIRVMSAGLDISDNQVVVGIEGLTDSSKREVLSRFGEGLRFEERKPAQSDACPVSNCRPIKGGIKMVGSQTGKPCTAGFIVRRETNNALSMLTAGHCIWVQDPNGNPLGDNWYHLDAGAPNDFGENLYHTFVNPPGAQPTEGDVGLIDLFSNELPAIRNRIFTDFSGGVVHSVTGWIFDDDQTEGSQVCAYGYRSDEFLVGSTAYKCTTIRLFDEIMHSCAPLPNGDDECFDIGHVNVYSYNLMPGDSGGPIVKRPNLSSLDVKMMGTHVHSLDNNKNGPPTLGEDGWYTPYGYGVLAYITDSGAPGGYALCVTAACP